MINSDQDKFLKRIKSALRQAHLPDSSPEHPGSFQGYTFQTDTPAEKLAERFKQELETLSGYVHIFEDTESIVSVILEILQKHEARQIMAWDDASLGLPWLKGALTEAGITTADSHLAPDAEGRKANLSTLDGVQVGLTGAQGGLADTGSLALVSGSGRGRLASLLPPVHIALLPAHKLYPSLPAFLSANPNAATAGSNLVFITGPSRTADIELTLSMGVHGPKEIHVIITPD